MLAAVDLYLDICMAELVNKLRLSFFFLCLFLGLIMVKNSGLSNIVRLDAIAVRQRAATPMTQSKRL